MLRTWRLSESIIINYSPLWSQLTHVLQISIRDIWRKWRSGRQLGAPRINDTPVVEYWRGRTDDGALPAVRDQRDDNLVEAIYDGWLVSFVVQVQDWTHTAPLSSASISAFAPSLSWSKFAPTSCLSRSNPSPWRLKKGTRIFLLALHSAIFRRPRVNAPKGGRNTFHWSKWSSKLIAYRVSLPAVW